MRTIARVLAGAAVAVAVTTATTVPAAAVWVQTSFYTSQKLCRSIEYEYAGQGHRIITSCAPTITPRGTYYQLSWLPQYTF